MKHERQNSVVHLMDCIEGMKQYPDKYFQLAIVDPPYGLGKRLSQRGGKHKDGWQVAAVNFQMNISTIGTIQDQAEKQCQIFTTN